MVEPKAVDFAETATIPPPPGRGLALMMIHN
jgi:hypothetical protein